MAKSPVLLSRKVIQDIGEAIRKGNTKKTAFQLAGVNQQTGYDWLAEQKRGTATEERQALLDELAEVVAQAQAEVQEELVAEILSTAKSGRPNTWQAAAWYLERTDPEGWGRKDQVAIGAGDGAPLIQLNQVVLADTEKRQQGRDLLRQLAGTPARLALGPGADSEPAEG